MCRYIICQQIDRKLMYLFRLNGECASRSNGRRSSSSTRCLHQPVNLSLLWSIQFSLLRTNSRHTRSSMFSSRFYTFRLQTDWMTAVLECVRVFFRISSRVERHGIGLTAVLRLFCHRTIIKLICSMHSASVLNWWTHDLLAVSHLIYYVTCYLLRMRF